MTRQDIMDAIEGARDHGRTEGFGFTRAGMRPPSPERIANWIVRTFRELDDQSITVGEIVNLLGSPKGGK